MLRKSAIVWPVVAVVAFASSFLTGNTGTVEGFALRPRGGRSSFRGGGDVRGDGSVVRREEKSRARVVRLDAATTDPKHCLAASAAAGNNGVVAAGLVSSRLVLPSLVLVASSYLNPSGGFRGVASLAVTAAAVVVPATQCKSRYGVSVGYGASVAFVAMSLRYVFRPVWDGVGSALTASTIFYGARLATYLLLREGSGWKPGTTTTPREKSRIGRVAFALFLSAFYACLTTPILYLLRNSDPAISTVDPGAVASSVRVAVAWIGVSLAWIGALLEAVADTQKFIALWRDRRRGGGKRKVVAGDEETGTARGGKGGTPTTRRFHGPTTGVYRFTRHPNYTGEVLFWFGTWLAGLPYFGHSPVAWICSSFGLFGIFSIMKTASARLERRQQMEYGGQGTYETWRDHVTCPLIPFVDDKN